MFERMSPPANERHALAVLLRRRLREPIGDVAAVIGGDALEPAYRHGLFVDPTPPARGLARPIAGAAKNPREDVGLTVEHVRVRVTPLRDEADVLRHVGMRRTRPLAVHDFVEVARVTNVGRLHGARELTTEKSERERL